MTSDASAIVHRNAAKVSQGLGVQLGLLQPLRALIGLVAKIDPRHEIRNRARQVVGHLFDFRLYAWPKARPLTIELA